MAKRHDLAGNGIALTTALPYDDVRRIVELVASQSAGGDILRASAKVVVRQSTEESLVYDLRNGFNITHLSFAVRFARLAGGRTRVHTEILSYLTSQATLFYFIPLGPKTMLGHHTYSVFMRKLESTIRDADQAAAIQLALGPLRGVHPDSLVASSAADRATPVVGEDRPSPAEPSVPAALAASAREVAPPAIPPIGVSHQTQTSDESARKAGGIALVVVGAVLVLIAVLWGFVGYYASQAPVLLVLAGGGLACIFGGARLHRDRNPARTLDWRSVTTGAAVPALPDLSTPEAEDSMATCYSCGASLREGAAYCGNCGAAVRAAVVPVEVVPPTPPVVSTPPIVSAPPIPPPPPILTPPPGIAVPVAPPMPALPDVGVAPAPPPEPIVVPPLVGAPPSVDDATRVVPPRAARMPWVLTDPAGERRVVSEALVVGRQPSPVEGLDETWSVTDPEGRVSKSHARFSVVRGRLHVTDLDSTNGVVVIAPDGSEREPAGTQSVEVPDGSEVELGGFVLAVNRGEP